MSGFAKLDSGIINSTIWVQPHDVLRVWIWFLSQADSRGAVNTAAPALSLICMVPLERMREILILLESPDPDSRSPNDDGRRIEKMDGGGWRIINYGKYRESRDPEERKEYQRNWDAKNRPSGHARAKQSDKIPTVTDNSPTNPDRARPETTKAEAERAEAEKKDQKTQRSADADLSALFLEFWSAYPKTDGKKAAVKVWTRDRLDRFGEAIIADVKRRLAAGEWREERYIPHASTYLNGERWKDGAGRALPQHHSAQRPAPGATDLDYLMSVGK